MSYPQFIEVKYKVEDVGIRTQRLKYSAEITHQKMADCYYLITASEKSVLESKVFACVAKVEDKWNKIATKSITLKTKEEGLQGADDLTKSAIKNLKIVDNLLVNSIKSEKPFNWKDLKDESVFNTPNPSQNINHIIESFEKPIEKSFLSYPAKPTEHDFKVALSFLDKIIKSKKEAKMKIASNDLIHASQVWEINCNKIDKDNAIIKQQNKINASDYQKKIQKIKDEFSEKEILWKDSKSFFIKSQEEKNRLIDAFKADYLSKKETAILKYCDIVLTNSNYPEYFPKSFELDYVPETKILIVDYSLPSIDHLPSVNEIKFIKNEFKYFKISENNLHSLFDNTMYNITLRTLRELFVNDSIDALDAISFNGWVNSINKATGKKENNCILSILAKKSEFLEVDLSLVDPKSCFKTFKGVGSSKLSGLTSIQPILQMNRTDKRFTNYYDVADSIDSSTNLASMDWEDFEHLIREVFAKEFSSNGGEVKVTQASRDGGVDAIAFDPDPIRGGKIVIQAKRYTNTVGVSAVRDLYGTVMNEGATKGILVTTADYGPDSYEFIKGKPLTLMNGSNLLYLLEKHGHQARINIKEAKLFS